MKILTSHVNAHQRLTSAEDLKNQVDTSEPLSPAIQSLPNGLLNKMAIMAGIEVMHGLSWLKDGGWPLEAENDFWPAASKEMKT